MTPTRHLLAALLLSAAAASPAAAQIPEPLFVHRGSPEAIVAAEEPSSTRPAIVSRAAVGMEIDRLFGAQGAAPRVVLNTGAATWTAQFERLDTDVTGFRSWVGAIDGIPHSHVVFTERDGVVSGLINAVGTTYQVRTEGPGSYLLEQVDVARPGGELDPILVAASDPPHAASAVTGQDDGSTIDVLMLYTPAARVQRGGTPAMAALVSQIISDTNTALSRSGLVPRVRLVAAREVPFVETTSMQTDLGTLRTQAAPLRDELRADLVQLLVASPTGSACGIGYLLTSLASPNFPAYSVADIACVSQYTPTHEMGHNMGLHHAPEDFASGALFPYSYGYKDAARGFRTILAYGCPSVSCPRVLNFSNPGVLHLGGVTGTATQDNARSIREAAHTIANFRQALPPPTTMPPGAPTGLRSTILGNSVTVAWDAVLNDGVAASTSAASGYVVQVGSATGAANLFNASVGNVTTASGTVGEGLYFWRVIATNSAGSSPASAEAQFVVGNPCIPPSAPRSFTFGVAGSYVMLAWTPPASGSAPLEYSIEVGSAAGRDNLLVAPVGALVAVGSPAPPGTYFVRVRARNACGTSAPSNEQVITVP